ALALGFGGEGAAADSLSNAPSRTEAKGRICKCGARCKEGSCCCGHHAERSEPPVPTPPVSSPRPRNDKDHSRPCLCPAPCGDPGIPTSTSAVPTGRPAALMVSTGCQPSNSGDRLDAPESSPRLQRWSSRIDRPPRP